MQWQQNKASNPVKWLSDNDLPEMIMTISLSNYFRLPGV